MGFYFVIFNATLHSVHVVFSIFASFDIS